MRGEVEKLNDGITAVKNEKLRTCVTSVPSRTSVCQLNRGERFTCGPTPTSANGALPTAPSTSSTGTRSKAVIMKGLWCSV